MNYDAVRNQRGFGRMRALQENGRVAVRSLPPSEVPAAHGRIADAVGGVADLSTVKRAVEKYLAVVWEITSAASDEPGYIVVVPLTHTGKVLIENDALDMRQPDFDHIAKTYDQIAAMYVWVIVTPGRTIAGAPIVLSKYQQHEYGDFPVYCRAVHETSERLFGRIGFSCARPKEEFPKLMVATHRSEDDDAAKLRGIESRGNRSCLRVAPCRTLDELARAHAVRAATYMAEQDCPYEEEFDGNDLVGTTFLGQIGNRPVSTVRVRYFGSFVKVERLAVLQEKRGTLVALETAKAAIRFCHEKGFRHFYGHSTDQVAPLWRRLGFEVLPGRDPVTFSGFTYREMVLSLPAHGEALRIGDDPYRLIRPEGAWSEAGVLEGDRMADDMWDFDLNNWGMA